MGEGFVRVVFSMMYLPSLVKALAGTGMYAFTPTTHEPLQGSHPAGRTLRSGMIFTRRELTGRGQMPHTGMAYFREIS